MAIHPRPDDHGNAVIIKKPNQPTGLATWHQPTAIATVTPDGAMPEEINRVPVVNLASTPTGPREWEELASCMEFEEPPFETHGKNPAAGAVVVEPDGRLWLVSPTNGFGNYLSTFPKGKTDGMSLKATALKEVFEEAGLEVELFEHLIDVTKTTSRTRYYLARRRGGNPASMCWEVQSVHLVPLERATDMLNQKVDHQVIDTLLERWGDWASWFFNPDHGSREWEAARSGLIPATRRDWKHLPLPSRRTRIQLDVLLDPEETRNLKLGFVPRTMEQKWFAYFDGGTLFEHRSWTGFCISEVHFAPEGDGLRAVYAEVNREPRQYSNTDDAEDVRLIGDRIRQLAHLTPADRNAEDPFLAGLKASMAPNYLGDPRVVHQLLEPFFQVEVNRQLRMLGLNIPDATFEATLDANNHIVQIFSGGNPDYTVIGTWNTAEELGALAVKTLDLDPDWYADENLFCILSEGLAGVGIAIKDMVSAYAKDPEAEFKRDLLPCLHELLQFTASVLMGTQPVMFPGKTLKDFGYKARAVDTPQKGLFDIDETEELEEDDARPEEEEESQLSSEIAQLRKIFGLPPLLEKPPQQSRVASKKTSPKKKGRPMTLPGPIGELAKKIGGVGVLACELGISPRTLRRWSSDGQVPRLPARLFGYMFKEHLIDPGDFFMTQVEE